MEGIVWVADARSFTFTFVSQRAEAMLGYATEDWLIPGFWVEHLHPDDKSWAPNYCASCTERLEPHEFEYRFIAKDGRVVWLKHIVTVVAEAGAPRWLRGLMIDITQNKQVEQQLTLLANTLEAGVNERTYELRRVSAQLTATEEREKRLLAEELHDKLSQLLAVIKIKLASMPGDAPQASIRQIADLVTQADQAVRSITLQLSPPILKNLGLAPTLEWLGEEMERLHGLKVQVDADECCMPLSATVQAVFYRSARELLHNVAKHAGAAEASLTSLCSNGHFVLVVSDAGRGFDPAEALAASSMSKGFGLRSIRERLVNIGGEFEVDSRPGHGTTVALSLPCIDAEREIE